MGVTQQHPHRSEFRAEELITVETTRASVENVKTIIGSRFMRSICIESLRFKITNDSLIPINKNFVGWVVPHLISTIHVLSHWSQTFESEGAQILRKILDRKKFHARA